LLNHALENPTDQLFAIICDKKKPAAGCADPWVRTKLEARGVNSNVKALMSASGTKQTSISTLNMSAFGGKADISDRLADVR
jgi:hypothetical protein